MFHLLSRLLNWMLDFEVILFLILTVGLIGLWTRFRRSALAALSAGAGIYILFGLVPIGTLALRPLENAWRRPETLTAPAGIIVLGGAIDGARSQDRGIVQFNLAGSRLTEGAMLAVRFPQSKLVFSGGNGDLMGDLSPEARMAQTFYRGLGLTESQLVFEDRSRNTFENAVLSAELLKSMPESRWILVTSAFHMPRAMGVFQKAGFNVIPWPSDYRTLREDDWRPTFQPLEEFSKLQAALHEYVGLAAYRLNGYSDTLFPTPALQR